jgi:hypothetical protein
MNTRIGRSDPAGSSRRETLRLLAASAGALGLGAGGRVSRGPRAELDASYCFYCPELTEITAPGPLVRPDGTALCSWSRRPYLDLNFEDARFLPVPYFQRYRMKKWDMYHLITPDHYLSFIVAWIGYAAFASVFVYDRASRTGMDATHIRSAQPEIPIMRDSTAGVTELRAGKVRVRFEVEGERRRLTVDWPGFGKVGLHAAIDLHHPAALESMCATHLTNPRRMHYDHKINCMTASGELMLGTKSYNLDPATAFGMLDFGRGFFPPKQFWYWAVSSGRDREGKLLGWNLGYGNSPDQTNENAVFHDGKLTKIGAVICEVPRGDLMAPWRVRTPDHRLDLTFIPENVRTTNLDFGAMYSVGQPALGAYSGHVTLDSGRVVTVESLFGLYEWMDQKW